MADVETPELDSVFELTNHIDRDWRENDCVTIAEGARNGVRSTSVGDVIRDETGRRFSVAGLGFTEF